LSFEKNGTVHIVPKHSCGDVTIDSAGNVKWNVSYKRRSYMNFYPEMSYYSFSEKKPKNTKYSYYIDTNDLFPARMNRINDTIFLFTNMHNIILYKGVEVIRKIVSPKLTLHSGKLNDSLFWVSYRTGGVSLFNLSGEPRYHLLDHEVVADVIQDHEGGIWFASLSNGIFYLKNLRVKTLHFDPNSRLTSISSLKEKLFIGYYNGDVFILNTNNFECNYYPEFKSQAPAILQADTSENSIYVGNRDFTAWSAQGSKPIIHEGFRTIKISEDNLVTTPFFTSYSGFYVKSGDTFIVTHTRVKIKDMIVLNRDTFLATPKAPFKFVQGKMIKMGNEKTNLRIEDMDLFRKGVVCATLGDGFLYYGPDTIFAIKKINGLLHNITTEVFVQNDSTIWLATIKGANKIVFDSRFNYTIYSYTIADGLISNEVVDFDVTDNYVWIASKRGLNMIDENDLPQQQVPELFLSIQKVSASGREISITDNKFVLADDDKNIQIFFNAISFSQNQSLEYSYQLLPGSKEWHNTSNRSIVFPTLAPGNYTLKIKASSDHVHWSEEIELEIIITPPYWQSWWFIMLMVLGICSIIMFIFRYRLKQQKLKTLNLEMEMKALRAQMNPHFIFNSMASIQNFILKGNIEDSNLYLTKFSRLIRGVLENSKTEFISIKKEIEILGLYIELERLRVNQFEYILQIDPAIPIEKFQIPPMILQPFVENAIWHGLASLGEKGILKLEFKLVENKILCIIDDNGKGRNQQKPTSDPAQKPMKEKSYGIEITMERLQVLKKNYQLEMELNIIDKFSVNKIPEGTRVEILLPIIKPK
jgi:hypothetical protein